MKYVSLFAGIGGFDLALNRLGHVCVWANEWDKYATILYNRNFGTGGSTPCDTRDIRTVPTGEIPDHDLLVGGFPCQAFSIAGKRRGFDDTRGTLFFEIARILKDKQPKFFILENVKGLLSHDNGNTFKTIIATLTELGYDLQWQVVNSKNFGVPQNRERVFIVGHLRGQPRPEVFPIRDISEKDISSGGKKASIVAQTVTSQGGLNARGTFVDTAYALDANYHKGTNTLEKGRRQLISRQPLRFLQRNQRNIEGDYSFTVDQSNTGGIKIGTCIRRLTPTECERLQGFPDGWTEGISDTQRYKCLGNAVTVNVVYEVARRLV